MELWCQSTLLSPSLILEREEEEKPGGSCQEPSSAGGRRIKPSLGLAAFKGANLME